MSVRYFQIAEDLRFSSDFVFNFIFLHNAIIIKMFNYYKIIWAFPRERDLFKTISNWGLNKRLYKYYHIFKVKGFKNKCTQSKCTNRHSIFPSGGIFMLRIHHLTWQISYKNEFNIWEMYIFTDITNFSKLSYFKSQIHNKFWNNLIFPKRRWNKKYKKVNA